MSPSLIHSPSISHANYIPARPRRCSALLHLLCAPGRRPHAGSLSSAPPGFCPVSTGRKLRTGSEGAGTWMSRLLRAGLRQSSTPTAPAGPAAPAAVQPDVQVRGCPSSCPTGPGRLGLVFICILSASLLKRKLPEAETLSVLFPVESPESTALLGSWQGA